MSFVNDLRVAFRSLAGTKGLATTVILTLALGIGANAAIFTLVRGVLLKPLVNRDEDRLIYIRQSAPGIGDDNSTFSVPEIQDLRASVKTLSAFGDFSTIGFTMIGLGEPREVQAGVVPWPSHRTSRRRSQSGGRGRPHVSFLDDHSQERSFRPRQNHPARQRAHGRSVCHHHRRSRTLGPISPRYRNHRQRCHQPASPLCNHGHGPHPSHD